MKKQVIGMLLPTLLIISGIMFATTYTTITIDGSSSDWENDEDLTTTTEGYTDYITWDVNNLYFAIAGVDVDGELNDGKVSFIYIDTDPQPTATNGTGSDSSIAWSITHTLPFTANYGFAYKSQSGSDYYNLRKYDSGWQLDQSYNGSVSLGTDLLEVSIPWSDIGSPSQIYVVIFMQNSNGSWTWSGAPSNAFTDGDGAKTFAHYLGYTITTGVSPDAAGAVDVSLPVELTSFTATPLKGAIQLDWVTESEIENLGFILERRTKDTDWKEIANYITHPELVGQGSVTYRTEYSFTDETVEAVQTYDYRLADVDYHGDWKYHSLIVMGVEVAELPTEFALLPAYPNPFNPSTTISYNLIEDGNVTLAIFDVNGREVSRLVDEAQIAGTYELSWDASRVSASVYFCQLVQGNKSATQKLIFLK